MRRICLTALIGLPATCKTTFSEHLLEAKFNRFNTLHFCYDYFFAFNTDIVHTQTDYKLKRNNILQILQSVIEILKFEEHAAETLKGFPKLSLNLTDNNEDYVIICDDNHFYRSMRYKLYQMARRYTLSFAQIYFECDLSKALERNRSRPASSRLPPEIIDGMHKKLECPKPNIAFERNTLILRDYQANTIDCLVLPFLTNSFANPLKPFERMAVKSPGDQSVVHQLDILIRKRINQLITDISDRDKRRDRAKFLNSQRKHLLNEFTQELSQPSQISNDPKNLLIKNLTPSNSDLAIQHVHDGESTATVVRGISASKSSFWNWCKSENKLWFMSCQSKADKVVESFNDKRRAGANLLNGLLEKGEGWI
uniref:Phosphoseryl-tRNA kinase n=1 Tax=Glossina pallidipes TaxID=7398 RepID=A0A1B0AJA2_GLOPL